MIDIPLIKNIFFTRTMSFLENRILLFLTKPEDYTPFSIYLSKYTDKIQNTCYFLFWLTLILLFSFISLLIPVIIKYFLAKTKRKYVVPFLFYTINGLLLRDILFCFFITKFIHEGKISFLIYNYRSSVLFYFFSSVLNISALILCIFYCIMLKFKIILNFVHVLSSIFVTVMGFKLNILVMDVSTFVCLGIVIIISFLFMNFYFALLRYIFRKNEK